MRRLDYITAAARAGAMICILVLGFGAPASGQTEPTTPSAADLTPSTTAATSGAASTSSSGCGC
jgi:hypothetical protein